MIETKLNYVEYEKKTPLPAEKINEIQRCIVADENEIERIDNSIKDNYYSNNISIYIFSWINYWRFAD